MTHLVREIKKYDHRRVAAVMESSGYTWVRPNHGPKNVGRMVHGLPRCELELILEKLRGRSRAPERSGLRGFLRRAVELWACYVSGLHKK